MGGAGRAAGGRTEGTGRSRGGEAQAVEELQRAWADHRRRQEGVERAERVGGRQEEGRGQEGRPPLVRFSQPAILPEQEGEMQERAWRRIRGDAAKLAERDREVAVRERRVREAEDAVARGAHRVLPDPEGATTSTFLEGLSPSGKMAREEDEEAGQGGGAGSRGGAGSAAAGQPQPRADADVLGLRVANPAEVCAAADTEGTWDGRGVDGGESGRPGPLREVGGEDQGKAGEEGDTPLQRPGRQGREAQGRGA